METVQQVEVVRIDCLECGTWFDLNLTKDYAECPTCGTGFAVMQETDETWIWEGQNASTR